MRDQDAELLRRGPLLRWPSRRPPSRLPPGLP
ncbi:hypothetical protein B1M_24265, partial [Burkholderia sp. TJI49]